MKVRPDSWRKLDRDARFPDLSDYARPAALALTARLVDTPVRSLHVTAAFIVCGLAAGALLAVPAPAALAGAAVLLQVKNLLDAVDGSLARAQNRPSRAGRYLDSVGDFAVNAAAFAGIGAALAPRLGLSAWLLAAAALLSALLQGTYYSVVTVAHRARFRPGILSRVDERAAPGDAGLTVRILQRLYLALYGWQDRAVASLLPRPDPASPLEAPFHPAVFTRRHLSFVSGFGLGTQLALESAAAAAAAVIGPGVPFLVLCLLLAGPGNLAAALDLARLRRIAGAGSRPGRGAAPGGRRARAHRRGLRGFRGSA